MTLVEYGLVRNHLFIWIIRREGIEFVERTLDPAGFELQVRRFLEQVRRGAEVASAPLGEILLPPAVHEGSGDLFFIPDKILNEIPFAALRNGGRYLVEDRAVGVMPSLSFFARTPERPVERSALLVGNPLFDRRRFPSMPNLAEAEAEVESIRPFYPDAEVLAGAEATRERLLAGLGRHSVLHYAGHALFNPRDPASSYLLLARSAGDPDVLYARDLAGLRLRNLRLVVLSACDTMAPLRTRNGKLASLVRPFLSAGVPAVLGALWDVDDRASGVLLRAFHRHLVATGSPARALREAQLESLRSRDPSLRSPSAWAVFELIGF